MGGWPERVVFSTAGAALDTMPLLAPNPDWVKTLPNGKLPDRQDFLHHGRNLSARVRAWSAAAAASEQLADEFAPWLRAPDIRSIRPIRAA